MAGLFSTSALAAGGTCTTEKGTAIVSDMETGVRLFPNVKLELFDPNGTMLLSSKGVRIPSALDKMAQDFCKNGLPEDKIGFKESGANGVYYSCEGKGGKAVFAEDGLKAKMADGGSVNATGIGFGKGRGDAEKICRGLKLGAF